MTHLFGDGFGHVDDSYELLKWDEYFSDAAITYGAGYGVGSTWGARLEAVSVYYIGKNLAAGESTIIFGARFKLDILSSSNEIISFIDDATPQCEVRIKSDGSIAVYRSSTEIAVSATSLVSIDTWFYLEVKIVFNNTTGSVVAKLNGTERINQTGLDTCVSANEYITKIRLYSNGDHVYVDDLYICNTSGSVNNDFYGDISIATLYPTSDGTYTNFTPSTGSDHYALVDDPQLVSDTDHNESSTIGHKDSYGMTTFSETGIIKAVQVCAAVKNTSTGTMNVQTLCRSGITPADNFGSNFALSQTMKGAITIHEKEPTDDVAWTAAKINAAEFGLKVAS